jgi:hypothetical protein
MRRNQSTAVSSDTDGQNMPASRYDVDITWTWRALIGDKEVGLPEGVAPVAAQATILQPDELHATAGEAALPGLAEAGPDEISVLRTTGTVVYTAVGVSGVGSLQEGIIAASPTLSTVDVWAGLTPAVYKSVLMRALAGAGMVLLGDQAGALVTTPIGRPQIVKVWKPYSQHLLEAQVGQEGASDAARTAGGQVSGGHVSEHFTAEGSTAVSGGTGRTASELDTVGNYRGVYQDAEMALVRTAVYNEFSLGDGKPPVVRRGEVVLNVLLTDVLRHRYGFDDPHAKIEGYLDRFVTDAERGLVVAADEPARAAARQAWDKARRNLAIARAAAQDSRPAAAVLDSALAPPASVQDGLSGAVVWSMTFDGGPGRVGLGGLIASLAKAARAVGGAELVAEVSTVASWFGPLLAKMNDGGQAWVFETGGGTYRLVMNARQVGPARGSRAGGTGSKIYERGPRLQDAGRRNIVGDHHGNPRRQRGSPTRSRCGASSPHPHRPGRRDDTRGSNLLFMRVYGPTSSPISPRRSSSPSR